MDGAWTVKSSSGDGAAVVIMAVIMATAETAVVVVVVDMAATEGMAGETMMVEEEDTEAVGVVEVVADGDSAVQDIEVNGRSTDCCMYASVVTFHSYHKSFSYILSVAPHCTVRWQGNSI